jgi:hypothetical protein
MVVDDGVSLLLIVAYGVVRLLLIGIGIAR